jgi:transposase
MYLRLKWVGEDFMCCVKAVAMDMNTNYSSAFADKYPEIEIVYDGFHILKWFNDQVIDSLRRSETKRLKKEADVLSSIGEVAAAAAIESERKLLFGSRWNLLVNERTLRAKDAMNAGLNAQAKRIAKIDGRDPTEVGHRISSGILKGTNTSSKTSAARRLDWWTSTISGCSSGSRHIVLTVGAKRASLAHTTGRRSAMCTA